MATTDPQGAGDDWSTIGASVVLTLLVVAALVMVVPILRPPSRQVIDTQLHTGTHLSFVFVAPTNVAGESFVPAVDRARSAMRSRAKREGLEFSTVGIADKWQVKEGLEMLAVFGAFDEVTVGRNWMNTGVQEYINTPKAPAKVPQVIVTLQPVNMDTTPYVYGDRRVLLRLIGTNEIEEWAAAGFPLRVTPPEIEARDLRNRTVTSRRDP